MFAGSDAFGQVLLFEVPPNSIMSGIGNIREAIGHAKREKNGSKVPDRNTGFALLYLQQGHSAD